MFHRWARRLPQSIHVVPIKLPGREDRNRQPAIDNMPEMVEQLTRHLHEFVSAAPLALFGHSMGGLISYEWAQRLRREGIDVEHVFVSSCRPPSRFCTPQEPLHTLSDKQMLDKLTSKYGAGPISKDELDLMMFMAPTIRADLQLLETYRHADQEPLACPLTVLGGAEDPRIHRVLLQEWEAFTSDSFKLRVFSGHHFYLRTQDDVVTKFVATRLDVRA
jgi:medium-chain acyl-[acyl-carrier-protein] hydrolase